MPEARRAPTASPPAVEEGSLLDRQLAEVELPEDVAARFDAFVGGVRGAFPFDAAAYCEGVQGSDGHED